ncbi:hypothetical protein [Streptomyces africanus]|uniref:hypothetical protein n=1 Tax=Streptomyces africanus TaxID=231024 RepID=UPI000A3AE6EC|nr:hypothetical protein [Streptomyces africanus]
MEASELAVRAVGVVVAAATGAATAVGERAGTAVSDLVRTRLSGTGQGRTALEGLDAQPDSDIARSAAEGVLREEIEADPQLRQRLEIHLSAPAHFTHSVVFTGGRQSGNAIAIGPLTINKNTPGGRAILGVGAVLVVLLLGLGVYGGVQLFSGDDSPGQHAHAQGTRPSADVPGTDSPGSEGDGEVGTDVGAVAEPLSDEATVRSVLPDVGSLPEAWEITDSADVQEGVPEDCSSDCQGVLFTGTVRLEEEDAWRGAFFYVQAYDSNDHATQRFADIRADKDGQSDIFDSMSVEPLGDESVAFRKNIVNKEQAECGVRVGTVVAWVTYATDSGELDPADLTSLARMLAERAQQAQDGETPSASAVL